MPKLTLTFPDGSKKQYDKGVTPIQVAQSIGPRLAQAAIAAKVDDAIWDSWRPIEHDAEFKILTWADGDGRHAYRHSTAHILAHAITRLYPNAKPTIGPPIEDGFYYDFDDLAITPADFPKIEAEMKKIVDSDFPVERQEVTLEEVKKLFAKKNKYKVELAEEFAKDGKKLSIYRQGDFVDLCRGGHLPRTGAIKAFKLMKVAGAYWRGDQKNKQLTRIYATSYPTQKELDAYLKMLEEAEKRDHRKIGKEQDLFCFSELVGPGLPLWTPKGTIMRNLLDEFIWQLRKERGYQKVCIPHLTKKDLYVTSGHWAKYGDDLYKIKTRDGHEFALKPMNCPHHTQIFGHVQRSYRDMPQRYAETTMVYRDEQTGELAGLSRVLCITQDDAHVFCRESQLKDEVFKIWDIISTFYGTFGFKLHLRLSLHDPKHFEKYVGTKEMWEFSESQLREFVKERKADAVEVKGEAAFYGPKLDFKAHDAMGREWQVATIQIDRNMPERFDLTCINEKNEKERVVMIHAAIMGSIERFLSVLIEHFAGRFPLWLSPEQVRILTIADRFIPYAEKVCGRMREAGLRTEVDASNETINKKVREAQLAQVPYIIVIGEKEVNDKTVNVRTREGKVEGAVDVDALVKRLVDEVIRKK